MSSAKLLTRCPCVDTIPIPTCTLPHTFKTIWEFMGQFFTFFVAGLVDASSGEDLGFAFAGWVDHHYFLMAYITRLLCIAALRLDKNDIKVSE